MPTDAFLAERGHEVNGFERFEVALEPALHLGDLGTCRGELVLELRPLLRGVLRDIGERAVEQTKGLSGEAYFEA